ncbi:MAG: VOC family protein [Chloroflexota bacterium]|nr:VOC family protein [Chloroflexota bacterium]MDE2948285.1 VOC family protein [Chloroflexota bacterium]
MNSLPIDSQITFVYTVDLARSARFYEEVLGFPLALDQGTCRIYRVLGPGAYIGICQSEEAPEDGAGLIFTLVTPDVDGWYERIIARGWACEHPPRRNATYRIYHFFLRDPSGYRIEIQRFERNDWDSA